MEKIDQKLQSVSDQILGAFLESLASEKGFEEVSERLKKIVLDDKIATDKTLHKAIFDEEGL